MQWSVPARIGQKRFDSFLLGPPFTACRISELAKSEHDRLAREYEFSFWRFGDDGPTVQVHRQMFSFCVAVQHLVRYGQGKDMGRGESSQKENALMSDAPRTQEHNVWDQIEGPSLCQCPWHLLSRQTSEASTVYICSGLIIHFCARQDVMSGHPGFKNVLRNIPRLSPYEAVRHNENLESGRKAVDWAKFHSTDEWFGAPVFKIMTAGSGYFWWNSFDYEGVSNDLEALPSHLMWEGCLMVS